LPGPAFSGFAPQDFRSTVALGRLRRDFGLSYGSFMFTDREISGGGHNRVLGPDLQWRATGTDILTGQFLYSNTEDPTQPPPFAGKRFDSHAGTATWDHQQRACDWRLRYNDFGDDFRADDGFVPQVGFREGLVAGGWRLYPTGWLLNFIRLYGVGDRFYTTGGDDLGHDYFPGIFFLGSRNLNGQFELHLNKVPVGAELQTQKYLSYFLQFDPIRRLPRVTLQGRVGDLIDFDNGRVGKGTNVSLAATIRPFVHLTLSPAAIREWLEVDEASASGRLYTAVIGRLKAVYVVDSRSFIRAIGQYVTTKRDTALYAPPLRSLVARRDGNFLGSVLYGYRLNWQTVLFVGYGDNGLINESNTFIRTDRSLFLKVSYAWQR
jgi:hypothetical protein